MSERVFFNHFPRREDAFLGVEQPVVDEVQAGALIADARIPLITGAVTLVSLPHVDPEIQRRRAELVATQPVLLARAHELLGPVRQRCTEIIQVALVSRHPELPSEHVDRLARVVVAAASELLDVDVEEAGFVESLRTILDHQR